ncbi:MAG: lysophospholipid acyltransferase family protein [Sporomusaceae bacterium]|nr:lysophospholipid acyltransferase family protein [Sporomusaceae bacterium]
MLFKNFQYNLLKAISAFVCLLPYSLVCHIGRSLGYLFYLVGARQRRRAISQSMDCLQISLSEAKQIVHTVFGNLGQTLMEVLYTPALTPEKIKKHIAIEGLEHLRGAIDQGRGVVLLTAHIGNWEWLGAVLANTGLPITTIAKPQPNPHYTRLLNEYREKMGLEVFNRSGAELVKAARALKKGKALGFLADEDGGVDGIFVDFFNRKSATPAGPAVFARKFGSIIVPAFIFHRPEGGHQIVIKPAFPYERYDDETQELYENTAKMTQAIEEAIRNHPSDWIWFRKRWNTKYPKQ